MIYHWRMLQTADYALAIGGMLDRPQVHRTAGSGWASPRRAPQGGRLLVGQFPHRAPQHVGHACRVRGSVPFWLSPAPVTTTASGTSGCRVRMVTRAASSAVITWRHDGIGTRRFHRPPPFSSTPPRQWRTESQRCVTLMLMAGHGPVRAGPAAIDADPGTTRWASGRSGRQRVGYRGLVAAKSAA